MRRMSTSPERTYSPLSHNMCVHVLKLNPVPILKSALVASVKSQLRTCQSRVNKMRARTLRCSRLADQQVDHFFFFILFLSAFSFGVDNVFYLRML